MLSARGAAHISQRERTRGSARRNLERRLGFASVAALRVATTRRVLRGQRRVADNIVALAVTGNKGIVPGRPE